MKIAIVLLALLAAGSPVRAEPPPVPEGVPDEQLLPEAGLHATVDDGSSPAPAPKVPTNPLTRPATPVPAPAIAPPPDTTPVEGTTFDTVLGIIALFLALVLLSAAALAPMLWARRSLLRLAYEVALSFGAPTASPLQTRTLVTLALRLAALEREVAHSKAPQPRRFASPVLLALVANGALDPFFDLLAAHGPTPGSRPFPALRALAARSSAAAPGPDPAA